MGVERASLGATFQGVGRIYPSPVITSLTYQINLPPTHSSLDPHHWASRDRLCNDTQSIISCQAYELLAKRVNQTGSTLHALRRDFQAQMGLLGLSKNSTRRLRRQIEAFEGVYNFLGIASEREVTEMKETQIAILDNENHLAKQLASDELVEKSVIRELELQHSLVLDTMQEGLNNTLLFEAETLNNLSIAMHSQAYLDTAAAFLARTELEASILYGRLSSLVVQCINGQVPTILAQYSSTDVEFSTVLLDQTGVTLGNNHIEVTLRTVDLSKSPGVTLFALHTLLVRAHPVSTHFIRVSTDYGYVARSDTNVTYALTDAQVSMCIPPSTACGYGWTTSVSSSTCVESLFNAELVGVRDLCTHHLRTNITTPVIQSLGHGTFLLANVQHLRETCVHKDHSRTISNVTVSGDIKYAPRCNCATQMAASPVILRPSPTCEVDSIRQPVVAMNLFLPLLNADRASWVTLQEDLVNMTSSVRVHLPDIGLSPEQQVKLDGSRGRVRELAKQLQLRPLPHPTASLLDRLARGSATLIFRVMAGLTVCISVFALVVACIARKKANAVQAMLLPSVLQLVKANPFSDDSVSSTTTPHPTEVILSHPVTDTLLLCTLLIICVTTLLLLVPRLWTVRRYAGDSSYMIMAIISDGTIRSTVHLLDLPPQLLVDIVRVTHTLYEIPTMTECSLHITNPQRWVYRLEILFGRDSMRTITTSTTLMTAIDIPHEVEISHKQFIILKEMIMSGHVRIQYFLAQKGALFIPIREKVSRIVHFRDQACHEQE